MGRNGKAIDWNSEWIVQNFDKYYLLSEIHEAYCKECSPVSFGAFKSYCRRHKLHSNFSWTEEEKQYIRDHYSEQQVSDTIAGIQRISGRVVKSHSVRSMASNLGVRLNNENRLASIPKPRWSDELSENDWNGYRFIKYKGRWITKQKYIYELTFGELPSGYTVIFVDGNRENYSITNLAAVTRSELAYLNKEGLYGNELSKVAIQMLMLERELNR